jgi:putative ABC transport system substrate-binding protein
MHFDQLRRRDFVALLGGAAAWPLAARAQQPKVPVIGFLHVASANPFAHLVAAFRQGLNETGYSEGQNVAIEFRWAEGQSVKLPAMAADLVGRQVALIVAGGVAAALAAKEVTKTIPIVFNTGGNPIKLGLVTSLNRPGGNATGVNIFTSELAAKRLELLRELVPTAALIGVLLNPDNPTAGPQSKDMQQAARALGQKIEILHAATEDALGPAFTTLAQLRAGGLLVGADPFLNSRRNLVVALAARHGIPALYEQREFALAGGLMSYGTSLIDGYRQVGIYAGRILKGETPAELPVVQSTRFDFVINLNAAKALGLELPLSLSARATEVIE